MGEGRFCGPHDPKLEQRSTRSARGPAPRRIAIIGNSGTGKSRLARLLGSSLHLPVVHLDQHYWQPGWQEPSPAEWQRNHRRLIGSAEWILDGNYGSTMQERLERADMAILLEAPRLLSLYRVWRRALTHLGRARPDLDPGCPEVLPDGEFHRWIWDYHRKTRPVVIERLERFDRRGGTVVHLRDRAAVRSFLESFGSTARE